jgi:non-specific serine/threonine protein kinase
MPLGPVAAALTIAAVAVGAGWQGEPPLPLARGEVAATTVGGEIAVVGGLLGDGTSSQRVDLYLPSTRRWRRVPDLPRAVNHALAAAWRGKLYVAGGYGSTGVRLRSVWVLEGRRWRPLPPLPYGLAAGGAAVLGSDLYLVGGVTGSSDRRVLARRTLVLDLAQPTQWRFAPGPTGREHLAVTTAGGRIYAIGGRSAGYDTNSRLVQSWRPGASSWRTLAPVPGARGGTGAAAVGDTIVSVGGEQPAGTIATVFAYSVPQNAWRKLPDLPTPRHGLGVAAAGGRVFAIGGGRTPGLAVSDVSESIAIGSRR